MVLDTVRRLLPSSTEDSDSTTETPEAGVDDVDLDDVFEVLGNVRRRRILRYITDPATDEIVSLRELASHIAALENDIPEDQLGSQQRKRVYISLYQHHLPRMNDAGVLEFEKHPGVAYPTSSTTVAANVLDTVDAHVNGGDA